MKKMPITENTRHNIDVLFLFFLGEGGLVFYIKDSIVPSSHSKLNEK